MKFKNDLSVRAKILFTVIVSVVALSVVIYAISTRVLLTSYETIEHEGVVEDLRRAKDAIGEFSNQQMIKVADWAAWDEAYEYTRDRNTEWTDGTLYGSGMANLDNNLAMFTDTTGEIFFLKVADIKERTEVATTSVANYFTLHKELVTHMELDSETQGIAMLPEGPMIVVSLPVRTSEGLGPLYGSISFGRYLDEEKVAAIGAITHLSLSIFPYASDALPEDVALAKQRLAAGEEYVVTPMSIEKVTGYTVLYDLLEEPALIVRVDAPRPVFAQGQITFLIFMGIGAIALLLFGIFMIYLLDKLVIARFLRLTKDVEQINNVRDLSIRVQTEGTDDIGKLSDKINQMLAWLGASTKAEAESKKAVEMLLEEIKLGKERAEEMVVLRTKELADEKARLLASINSLSFGFVIADATGNILLRNPALMTILGKTPVSVGELATLFLPTFDLAAFCEKCLTQKTPQEQKELSYGKKFLRFLCAPISAENTDTNDTIGYVLIIEDITEAKVMERSREEFFSIASHELRTPLTAIRGNTGLLLRSYKDKLLDPEMKTMLEDIDGSSARLISIVNDFLEVSRLEQGKLEMKNESVDLVAVIESAVRNLSELAKERKLTLTFVPPVSLPLVRGNRDRLEQVLDNLIGNAVKFTSAGSITVSVAAVEHFLKVSVTDTGVGISEHNQTRLFRKFQQAGESMLARDVSQSTGLGLYISKLIVTAMGGQIQLEQSELGKGSTFIFTVPVDGASAPAST